MMTREDEIERVHGRGTHVVILGAGASYASTLRNPEKYGKKLPLMRNIVDVVGLNDILKFLPEHIGIHSQDFEKLYSTLCKDGSFGWAKEEMEARIFRYFQDMELPDEPTIYDYLILSLRSPKDVIATFNWDPFLYQAYQRNAKFIKSPGILSLHGTVALGYNPADQSSGPTGWTLKSNGYTYPPTQLLYPVENKDYNTDPYIKGQWVALSNRLNDAQRVSIFGYSAPVSDVEAIELLQMAWGTPDQRNMEQFELIDIRPQDEVRASWSTFIHSHHYDYSTNFFDSSLAKHPRRSVESFRHFTQPLTPDEMFQAGNPVPQDFKHMDQMWEWYRPLIEAEEK